MVEMTSRGWTALWNARFSGVDQKDLQLPDIQGCDSGLSGAPTSITSQMKASKTDPFWVGIQFQDGRFLTRARLVMEVKEAISAAGVDSSPYSGHSFRSGAATTAARQGIAEATIQKLGRWKSSAYNTKDAKTRPGGSVTAPGRQPMRLRRTKLWDGV